MTRATPATLTVSAGLLAAAALLWPQRAAAHCDGLDGPVVQAARRALDTGRVEPVLVWIQPRDDGEVRRAFQHTLAVRRLGPQAKELADRYFFETLVRVHRAGEGAPYTGLKPAGRDLGPAIPAADQALETGSPRKLVALLSQAVHDGLHGRYVEALQAKKRAQPGDVRAGRDFVRAYVEYVHFVERVYQVTKPGHGHDAKDAAPPAAHHAD